MEMRSIAEWMAKRYISRDELAKKVGVSKTTITLWQKKPSSIKMRDAVRLAQAFGCGIADIDFFCDKIE